MADHRGHASGPRDDHRHPDQAGPQPPVAPSPSGYHQGGGYAGAPPGALGQQGFAHQSYNTQGYGSPSGQPGPRQNDMSAMSSQMSNMALGVDGHGTARGKKKDRHAYHNINQDQQAQRAAPFPQPGGIYGAPGGQFQSFDPNAGAASQSGFAPQWNQQAPESNAQFQPQGGPGMVSSGIPGQQLPSAPRTSTPLHGAPVTSQQGKVDPEQIPSIPWSRDAPAQYYLEHVYPTMELHLPPPSSVPFVAIDQGNASPKFARLTLNNIPASSDALSSTSIPLGLILQPLARKVDGEQPVPVVDFGDAGPPRCRRCRTYINPFMVFRSGGNKMVCNMCTFPNDVPPEYFAPTDPSGARVDRTQRPELSLGTVEFTAPREYWTKEPVPQRWLFMIDVSMEAVSKGFLEAFCQGARDSIYGESEDDKPAGDEPNGVLPCRLAPGSRVGIMTYDKEVHFFNLKSGLEQAQMVVMPDIEDPFVPISEGLFVDPLASKAIITSLLERLPKMFGRIKNPEPALSPALDAALDALRSTGGRAVCSLSSLPTWGPGRLFMRERPELRDTDGEKAVFKTEHPSFIKTAKGMTESGVGVDFFLAAPQGGYLDIATIGHVSEKTGGEVYYYPNFNYPRDTLKLSREISHCLERESGFQALLKVRCSNGLQVSNYFGNFTQHTFGADLEFGVIDSDKAFGVVFSYDGKLDSKLDAHFQSALLYTTASGERRIRCSNICASVSEGAMESMKLVDQDAVVSLFAKQAAFQIPERNLRDIRSRLQEKTIDILSAYRKNFSGSHPPGQLVLPEHLKEFAMYMLSLLKCRALKAGVEPSDRRVFDMHSIKSMGSHELSLFLYPRIFAIHALGETDGFPDENGHLHMPQAIRASYGRVDEGGAYLVDCGHTVLLWLHVQVSPNLLEDLFGPGIDELAKLDAFNPRPLPVLETHLNAQVRNILQYMEDNRGSKAMTIQLARQGLDGAEFEFARLLVEDRGGEAQSYVDWLVHVHRHIQLELQGQRQKAGGASDNGDGGMLATVAKYL